MADVENVPMGGANPLEEEYDRQQMALVMQAREAQQAINRLGAGTLETQLQLSVRYGPDNPGRTDREKNLWAQGAQYGYALGIQQAAT
jgi:hypothetical protein